MSLINQMLRDLESRRVAPTAAGGAASLALAAERMADSGIPLVSPQARSDVSTGGAQRWLIGTIVLLAVLLGLLLWASQPPWQEQSVRVVAEDSVASVPVVQMTVEPVTSVARVPAEPVVDVDDETPLVPKPAVAEKRPAKSQSTPVTAEPAVSAPQVSQAPVVSEKSSLPVQQKKPEISPVSNSSLSAKTAEPVQRPADETTVSKRIRPLSNKQRAEQALRRGVSLLGQGQQAEAELALQETLQLDPRHLRARETLAALYFNNSRLSEAQTLLAEGLRLTPRAAGLAQLYARLLAEQDDLATALITLLRARPPLAENPDYHALLAALLQRAGQHARAVQTYRELLAQRNTVAPWWMGLAISLEAEGETAAALEAYVKAHQLGAGLDAQVLAYLGSRIRALAPVVAAAKKAAETAKAGE